MENKNALIAEFIGWGKCEYPFEHVYKMPSVFPMEPIEIEDNTGFYTCWPEKMKFNTDWNWLMPVVVKCHAISKEKQELFPEDKDLDDPKGWRAWSYRYISLSTDIDYVYKAVIRFIKWYNRSL